MSYKLLGNGVKRLADNAIIPSDVKNRDWAEFQIWVSFGNSPLPKDPPPQPTKDELDAKESKEYAKLISLKGMSPSEVQAWVDSNINTLADVKDALKTLAIAASILARRI